MLSRPFDITSHLPALRRYARVLTRRDQDADDLVQGALLRAFERRNQFREGADLRVWLMTVLNNHFIDQIRSRRASEARDQAWAELNPGFVTPAGEQAARLSQLRQALMDLPSDQRKALHLVAIEGMGMAEAAQVLDVPVGTIMSRVSRARASLRRFEDRPDGATSRVIPIRDISARSTKGGRNDSQG